jgi:hypothetical protein
MLQMEKQFASAKELLVPKLITDPPLKRHSCLSMLELNGFI